MPQLDILSFPSQLFWICVVFLIGLVISLKYILPSAAATIYGRDFFLNTKYVLSHSDMGSNLVNNYITRLNASLDEFSKTDFHSIESFPQVFITAYHVDFKNAEKAFLSPFFFFSVSDTQILLIAFIISCGCLFLYLYHNFDYNTKDFPRPYYLNQNKNKVVLPVQISKIFK